MKENKAVKQGQSLVETVFAIGIMLIVVSAILALVISNIVGQKESEFQITANNLAREGIEVVRNIRDSNWLAGEDWDLGLSGGSSAIVDYDSRQLNFDYSDDSLYLSEGVYSHRVSGRNSGFHRRLELETICLCVDSNECSLGQETIRFNCGAGEQKIGIKIASIVEWAERGRSRKVTLEDLHYDWR